MMKKILLIGTGGTIASKYSEKGLSPALTAEDIASYVPDVSKLCHLETVQPFSLDSTNVGPEQWLALSRLIEERYTEFDGFVITHGTDTMAYT
ncbi:MAG: asparaginase, partial [Lachnospiraceae bacterium]|nr:asparaginase [Lachnospiraceae bacterium]